MSMTKQFLAATVAAFFISIGGLSAHDGHVHTVMGTVTVAAADHLVVKTTDGKEVTIKVTEKTKVTRGKEVVKVLDLKVGTRIVMTPVSEKEPLVAAAIQVGAPAKPAPTTASNR
jgi:hypothetical protein